MGFNKPGGSFGQRFSSGRWAAGGYGHAFLSSPAVGGRHPPRWALLGTEYPGCTSPTPSSPPPPTHPLPPSALTPWCLEEHSSTYVPPHYVGDIIQMLQFPRLRTMFQKAQTHQLWGGSKGDTQGRRWFLTPCGTKGLPLASRLYLFNRMTGGASKLH